MSEPIGNLGGPRGTPAGQSARDDVDLESQWLARLDASIRLDAGRAREGSPLRPAPRPRETAGPHPSSLDIDALLRECTITRGRSGGPGGQNRNKVETLVEIHHEPTGIAAHAGERRTVLENRRVAIMRLRLALAILVRAHVATGDCRTPLWRSRCPQSGKHAGKIMLNPEHEDYPAMLALGLDVLWACGLDPKLAATRLCCTSSQLVRMIQDHPHALPWVNAHRAAKGEHALK
jgi:hypothetical protein